MSAPALENAIATSVHELLQPYIAPFHAMNVVASYGEVLVQGHVKADDTVLTTILRVIVSHDHQQILIPNILMPGTMKHHGLGKQLIARILEVAEAHAWPLFVVDLVPSFQRRLVARGAAPVDDDETVLITRDTDLSHKYS